MEAASQEYVLALLRQSTVAEQSNVLSPVSIALALQVLHAGAAGKTRSELSHFLLKDGNDDHLKTHFDKLAAAFANVPAENVTLESATKLLLDKDFKPHQKYLNAVADNAAVENEDFSQPVQAAKNINSFVNDKTRGKISKIVEPNTVEGAQAVIVNAVYFKANWKEQFKKALTQKKDFHLTSGGTRQVDMMAITSKFPYTEDDLAQVLQLPYKDQSFSMHFILPRNREGGVIQLLKDLNAERLQKYLSNSAKHEVQVEVPKFKFEAPLDLKTALIALGVKDAFSRQANFTALSDRPLYVSDAIHKAVIEVNEEGAEAAAVTVMVGRGRGRPLVDIRRPFRFTADHSFLFLLTRTDVVLFAGLYQ